MYKLIVLSIILLILSSCTGTLQYRKLSPFLKVTGQDAKLNPFFKLTGQYRKLNPFSKVTGKYRKFNPFSEFPRQWEFKWFSGGYR
jgi:hypothetical protein